MRLMVGGRTCSASASSPSDLWSAEDEDGESGKLGGADVGFAIADAKAAEQVDGAGVELVGDFRW